MRLNAEISTLTIIVMIVAICPVAAPAAPCVEERGQPMTQKWHDLSFTPPAGLLDVTIHNYANADDTESLQVSIGLIPPNVTSADEIAEELKTRIERDMGPFVKLVSDSPITVAGQASRLLEVQMTEGFLKTTQRTTIVGMSADRYLNIAYSTPARDNDAGDRFQRILGSIGAADANSPAPTAPGFERYHMGTIALDVPSKLIGPNIFEFENEDGSFRFDLAFFGEGDEGYLDLDGLLAGEKQYGAKVIDLATEQFATESAAGQITTYRLIHDEVSGPREEAKGHAGLLVNDRVRVSIAGTAPPDQAQRLLDALLELASSLKGGT